MNELAKHIEALLLENDCVIVPDLGGFVAYYTAAMRVEEESAFFPPTRVIGFNPRMKMNDGALAQSYMTVYATSFSDATKMISRQVDEVLDKLHEDGKVELPNIGELRYSIHGTYDFTPYDNRLATPSLYALESFQMKELSVLKQEKKVMHPGVSASAEVKPVSAVPAAMPRRNQSPKRIHWEHAVAVVAVIALLFMFSVPVENTEIVHENYARLFPEQLFEKMENQSVVFSDIVAEKQTSENKKQSAGRIQRRKPVAVKEVKVSEQTSTPAAPVAATASPKVASNEPAATVKKESPKKTASAAPSTQSIQKKYHIIVASVGTEADARQMAEQLRKEGYASAQAIIGGGKMRVSIQSLATEKEAYQALSGIRENKKYQSAWVLKK